MTGSGRATGDADAEGMDTVEVVVRARDGSASRYAVGRLVMSGEAYSKVERRDLLAEVADALSEAGTSVGLLVTPARFLVGRLPDGYAGSQGWDTDRVDFERMADIAAALVADLMTADLRSRMRGLVDTLVVGVDLHPNGNDGEPHVETAFVVETASGRVLERTGKSYPTSGQQDGLIRNRELKSHFVDVDGDRVAVLVCHDLAAWNPRGKAVRRGERADVGDGFEAAIERSHPTIVVHLPHTVATSKTWSTSWASCAGRTPA